MPIVISSGHGKGRIVKITGFLTAHYSRKDFAGNNYWALEYKDADTGEVVRGKVSGGEANIYGILRHWNEPNDWDRSVMFYVVEHGIREFDRMVKDWPYAGSESEALANFIREQLKHI